MGSELKPWRHLDLPRKMCCAGGNKDLDLEKWVAGKDKITYLSSKPTYLLERR